MQEPPGSVTPGETDTSTRDVFDTAGAQADQRGWKRGRGRYASFVTMSPCAMVPACVTFA